MPNKALIKKFKDGSARVGIIGLGYVGLPLVVRFAEEGFRVTGFDTDPAKVEALGRGGSYIKHIPAASIKNFVEKGLLKATGDMSLLKNMDAVIVCVPTPLTKKREPDLSFVETTAREISKELRPGQLVSLESTTYPGTTEEVVLPALEVSGLKAGSDFFLVYAPEREDPGRTDYNTRTIPRVVGGVTEECLEAGAALYSRVVDRVVRVSGTRAAEMSKLLENIYRCVNIALVNELKMLTDKMGIDIWEVIRASGTKPFGFQPFTPGPGLGGHCIPIDPFYLSWKAREFDFRTRFIELAGEINTAMPEYVTSKVAGALEDRGINFEGAKVLVLGVAYKKDVDDIRESPGVRIIELLKARQARVDYNDPHVARVGGMRAHDLDMRSIELSDDTIKDYDCVVIVTDHSAYDYQWIVDKSALVVDTRGATSAMKAKNVVKA